MKIDGACHCSGIMYEAEVDPNDVGICHCTDCQVLSGTAFRTIVLTERGALRLLSGTPTIYVKTSESGLEREQAFCPECGSPLYSTSPGAGPKIHCLRVGTVRQRDQLWPTFQDWCRSAQSWVDELDSIPRKEKQ